MTASRRPDSAGYFGGLSMDYIANPVRVKAYRIVQVWDEGGGKARVKIDDGGIGNIFLCDSGMTARQWPGKGDYLVTQEDGYTYLNPKEVFERKYRLDEGDEPALTQKDYPELVVNAGCRIDVFRDQDLRREAMSHAVSMHTNSDGTVTSSHNLVIDTAAAIFRFIVGGDSE